MSTIYNQSGTLGQECISNYSIWLCPFETYKIFLDFLNIYTTHPSAKLFHYYLRSYVVKKQVGSILYCLKLSLILQRLHLVFPTVKLTVTSHNPTPKRPSSPSSNLVIINKEKEWKVEKILGSYWHHKRYQYLIKQKGFGLEIIS